MEVDEASPGETVASSRNGCVRFNAMTRGLPVSLIPLTSLRSWD